MEAFISYSHQDAAALERLHVHLATLKRDGLVTTWYDRNILAGDDLDEEISAHLESSGLFLLLVTPDFLNSDYCVEREMGRALERQAAGEARVIAIIAEPCDWQSTPLAKVKVVPCDGRAVSEWTNPNSAFLDTIREIRRAIEADQKGPSPRVELFDRSAVTVTAQNRYRAKRDFDDIDRSEFREAAFVTMRKYFRQAVEELDSIEDFRGRFRDLSATSFGCTIVNRARDRGTAHITVHMRAGDKYGLGDIYYSFEENSASNSAHNTFVIGHDEFELFLTSGHFGMAREMPKLSPEVASEGVWVEMLEKAGITSA